MKKIIFVTFIFLSFKALTKEFSIPLVSELKSKNIHGYKVVSPLFGSRSFHLKVELNNKKNLLQQIWLESQNKSIESSPYKADYAIILYSSLLAITNGQKETSSKEEIKLRAQILEHIGLDSYLKKSIESYPSSKIGSLTTKYQNIVKFSKTLSTGGIVIGVTIAVAGFAVPAIWSAGISLLGGQTFMALMVLETAVEVGLFSSQAVLSTLQEIEKSFRDNLSQNLNHMMLESLGEHAGITGNPIRWRDFNYSPLQQIHQVLFFLNGINQISENINDKDVSEQLKISKLQFLQILEINLAIMARQISGVSLDGNNQEALKIIYQLAQNFYHDQNFSLAIYQLKSGADVFSDYTDDSDMLKEKRNNEIHYFSSLLIESLQIKQKNQEYSLKEIEAALFKKVGKLSLLEFYERILFESTAKSPPIPERALTEIISNGATSTFDYLTLESNKITQSISTTTEQLGAQCIKGVEKMMPFRKKGK